MDKVFSNFIKLFMRRERWSIGIFKCNTIQDIFDLRANKPEKLFGEKGLRLSKNYMPIVADPFLFVYNERLYMFYECKSDHGHGIICVQSMSPEGEWCDHGPVIEESYHLSYPQVFSLNGVIYMIPEAAQRGRVLLYEAEDFPVKWRIRSTLIDEGLRDPTLFITENNKMYLLSTTKDYELRLYCSDTIDGQFVFSGKSITKDRRIARCAGSIFQLGDLVLRPVQDCSEVYGRSISLQEIEAISFLDYCEKPSSLTLKIPQFTWNSKGYHHISIAYFGDSIYVAIDGRGKDFMLNSLLLGFFRAVEK